VESFVDMIVAATTWHRSREGPPRVPTDLPADYRAILERLGPGEGFIGTDNYVRLYPPEALASLNEQYGFPEFLPGLFLFGSNGCGEAYAFDSTDGGSIVKTAFVPLDREYGARVASTLRELLEGFASSGPPRYRLNAATIGLEMEFKHPIALGGSPDEENQIQVPPEKHVEIVRFWARTFQDVKRRQSN